MTANSQPAGFNPDAYRMTIGDHLEELRTRLVLGLLPFVIVFIVFMIPAIGDRVCRFFCQPLMTALDHNGLSLQVYYHEVAESFMVYIRIGMVSALAVGSPWMLYQLWQFIAAGLYPHERKYVTKYLPLSITLLILGMLFLYYFVLPIMLEFFLGFNLGVAVNAPNPHVPISPPNFPAVVVQVADGQPTDLVDGRLWYDRSTGRLNIFIGGKVRSLPFGSDSLATPQIMLSDYINMVLGMLVSFGLAFQMPLVVLALVRIGIMEIATLKRMRRIVYFSMTLLAAFIVPDVATGMVALLVPFCLLYEFGIFLAQMSQRKADREAAASGND